MKAPHITSVITVATILTGCSPSPESARGFRLPDGNADAGRAAFVALQCYGCHRIVGEVFPDGGSSERFEVTLGGTASRVGTYGELVTSIINPSHKLAPGYPTEMISENGLSKMRMYNDEMTVQQLIDIVAYLQTTYDVVPPSTQYPVYPM